MSENVKLPELLIPRETAKICRVTTGHLANARSRGEGPPFVKFGAKILYPAEELRKYIADRIVDPTTRRAG